MKRGGTACTYCQPCVARSTCNRLTQIESECACPGDGVQVVLTSFCSNAMPPVFSSPSLPVGTLTRVPETIPCPGAQPPYIGVRPVRTYPKLVLPPAITTLPASIAATSRKDIKARYILYFVCLSFVVVVLGG